MDGVFALPKRPLTIVKNGSFTYEVGQLGLVFRYSSKGVKRISSSDVPEHVYEKLYGSPKPLPGEQCI